MNQPAQQRCWPDEIGPTLGNRPPGTATPKALDPWPIFEVCHDDIALKTRNTRYNVYGQRFKVQHSEQPGCNNLQHPGPADLALKALNKTARGRASRASAAPGTKPATTSSAVSATQPDRMLAFRIPNSDLCTQLAPHSAYRPLC